jgi:hypothetical protein
MPLLDLGEFSGPLVSIGIGGSFKKNRRVFDFSYLAVGIGKTVDNGNENVNVSFTTALQFEWGYDLVKSNLINIYPYAGFGLRGTSLSYSGPQS